MQACLPRFGRLRVLLLFLQVNALLVRATQGFAGW